MQTDADELAFFSRSALQTVHQRRALERPPIAHLPIDIRLVTLHIRKEHSVWIMMAWQVGGAARRRVSGAHRVRGGGGGAVQGRLRVPGGRGDQTQGAPGGRCGVGVAARVGAHGARHRLSTSNSSSVVTSGGDDAGCSIAGGASTQHVSSRTRYGLLPCADSGPTRRLRV